MTISLLRRIWRRIIVDSSAAAPRQRLTGFEPLEPRMVLSGFSAFFAPDYFSPPAGDYSHIERSGAEFARPTVEFGGYSDYNSFGHGMAEAAHDYRPIQAEPFVALFDNPTRGNDGWLGGSAELPLVSNELEGESEYGYDDGSLTKITIISIDTSTPEDGIGISVGTLPVISELAVDRILASFSSAQFTSLSSITLTSAPIRSLTDRDYNQVNSGGAVERHAELHEYSALTHGAASDATLSLAARQATSAAIERGALNSAANAALANQAAGVNSIAMQTADGSTANGQPNVQSNNSSDRQQNGLLELTDAERLKLKRKLPGSTTEIEEATSSTTGRSDQYAESDIQVSYDPTRPFNAVAIPDGSLSPVAGANLADDGLIEVLATDVTATLASGDVIADSAANRQLVMEPAVATYQAFEVVVDGDMKAADVAADAARLAGAVAMSGQPVVQAE